MESTRQKKVARLLQKELGDIFQKKGKEFGGKMITITVIRMRPDLSIAKVYLSIFPSEKNENTSLELIKTKSSQIRYELARKVKNQLRIVPELSFFVDDSLDYIDNIEELLKK